MSLVSHQLFSVCKATSPNHQNNSYVLHVLYLWSDRKVFPQSLVQVGSEKGLPMLIESLSLSVRRKLHKSPSKES